MSKTTPVRASSGNVFADLKLPDAEAYMAKAELAARIHRVIKNRKLTQAAAGKLLAGR